MSYLHFFVALCVVIAVAPDGTITHTQAQARLHLSSLIFLWNNLRVVLGGRGFTLEGLPALELSHKGNGVFMPGVRVFWLGLRYWLLQGLIKICCTLAFTHFQPGPRAHTMRTRNQIPKRLEIFRVCFLPLKYHTIPSKPVRVLPASSPKVATQGKIGQNVVWATAKKGLKIFPILFKTRFLNQHT